MKSIEWCLTTNGKKEAVPPIDIQHFVSFYQLMNKGNLEKLYVDLQEEKTAIQKEKTALTISKTAVKDLQGEKKILLPSNTAPVSKGMGMIR